MIKLVEGAERQKTPNEIALDILLAGLTIVFLLATVTLKPFAIYSGSDVSVTVLVALLVCLIPTTIGALLSAIGIAGMDRVLQHNILAMSGRAVEASGDVNVLLLDKTGTITLGNRQAVRIRPRARRRRARARGSRATLVARRRDARGAVDRHPGEGAVRTCADASCRRSARTSIVPFTAKTRMSGIDFAERPRDAQRRRRFGRRIHPRRRAARFPTQVQHDVARIAGEGGTPLVVADDDRVLGTIYLKDIVKGGMKERFDRLRMMGIRTVMITGDNPLTAAFIAREAGVDDFLAQATPEDKLALIRKEQAKGNLVAMTGDGTNDAPALAQADVGMAMNTGTQPAKEAGNMVDLDSNPTKLIEVVEIGKQLLMTRGALTTFSIANDVAKYFAIIPALFLVTFPELQALNIMRLATPQSAILSAVIFNALIIVALIPLALRGVKYRPLGAGRILRRNLLLYGVGGVIIPFFGIKAIDLLLHAFISREESDMKEHILISIRITFVLLVITCGLYPLAVWGIGQVAFRDKANGSLITRNGKVIGSALIGQNFAGERFFHRGRPSSSELRPERVSGGTNLGPTSKKLLDAIADRTTKYADTKPASGIPADAVTASARASIRTSRRRMRIAGGARRARESPSSRARPATDRRAHRGTVSRYLRRAARERAPAQSRARRFSCRDPMTMPAPIPTNCCG